MLIENRANQYSVNQQSNKNNTAADNSLSKNQAPNKE